MSLFGGERSSHINVPPSGENRISAECSQLRHILCLTVDLVLKRPIP